jgi:hypothetical protein
MGRRSGCVRDIESRGHNALERRRQQALDVVQELMVECRDE